VKGIRHGNVRCRFSPDIMITVGLHAVIHICDTESSCRAVCIDMTTTAITVLLITVILASATASCLMYVRIKILSEELERLKPKEVTDGEMDRIEESLSMVDTLPSD